MQPTTDPLGIAQTARPTDLARPHQARRRPAVYWMAAALRHSLLIAVSLIFMVPFYWMVITALKTQTTVFTTPIEWWPRTLHWENFATTANYPSFPFLRFLWNSFYYAGLVTVGTVLSCACGRLRVCAAALSRARSAVCYHHRHAHDPHHRHASFRPS